MQTLTLTEAQEHLPDLVRGLERDAELVITDADIPVAKLVSLAPGTSLRDLRPKSVGAILRPFPAPNDDLLGEMLNARP